jgi:hypothetical protein
MLGAIIGRVMVQRVLRGLAPEILEASSREGSIFSIALEMVIKA